MIDMGMHKGTQLWYTGGRSLAQLIEDGEVMAIPTPIGLIFKRSEIVTPIERMAAYTLDEVRQFAEQHGKEE